MNWPIFTYDILCSSGKKIKSKDLLVCNGEISIRFVNDSSYNEIKIRFIILSPQMNNGVENSLTTERPKMQNFVAAGVVCEMPGISSRISPKDD